MHIIQHPKTFWIGAASLMIGAAIGFGFVLQDWSQVDGLPYYGIMFRGSSLLLVFFGTALMFAVRHQLDLRREREDLLTLLFVLGALTWVMGATGLVFPLDHEPIPQRDVMVFFASSFVMIGVVLTTLGITSGKKTAY